VLTFLKQSSLSLPFVKSFSVIGRQGAIPTEIAVYACTSVAPWNQAVICEQLLIAVFLNIVSKRSCPATTAHHLVDAVAAEHRLAVDKAVTAVDTASHNKQPRSLKEIVVIWKDTLFFCSDHIPADTFVHMQRLMPTYSYVTE